MSAAVEEQKTSAAKEYQTLFWVPMLFQTAKNAENLIEEMLDAIQDFHDSDPTVHIQRKSMLMKKAPGAPKRRQQILGEVLDSEVVTTRVDVVLKSENTKYNLLSVLKRHFLFSQLRDYELEDVIDVMQAQYMEEGEVIIQEGDPGELFYILEEGTYPFQFNFLTHRDGVYSCRPISPHSLLPAVLYTSTLSGRFL
jgi:hypothetical protein